MRLSSMVRLDCNERFACRWPGVVCSGAEGSIAFEARDIDAARSLRDALSKAIEAIEKEIERDASET